MIIQLPSWCVWILGGEWETSANAAHVAWNWTWPLWLSLIAAMPIAIGILWIFQRAVKSYGFVMAVGLTTLRLLQVAILALMLGQITLTPLRTGKSTLAIAIDTSASMQTVDDYEDGRTASKIDSLAERSGIAEPTRFALATAVLAHNKGALWRKMADSHQLRLYGLGTSLTEISAADESLQSVLTKLDSAQPSSRLGDGLARILGDLRGNPSSAVVLFSDGINTEGPDLQSAGDRAVADGVPIYIVPIGSERPPKDVELSDLIADDVAFEKDVVSFDVTLKTVGLAGGQLELRLRKDGQSAPLASKTIEVLSNADTKREVLTHRISDSSEQEFYVEVTGVEDERNTSNNTLIHRVAIRDEPIRVLYAQSSPSYEYRYVKALLEQDRAVDLRCVLQEADPEYPEFDRSALAFFPIRKERLQEFDLLIIGDVSPALMTESMRSNVHEFVVEHGGSVIFSAGPRFMPWDFMESPWASLFPFEAVEYDEAMVISTSENGYTPRPTMLGAATPSLQLGDSGEETSELWERLPPLYWHVQCKDLKPGARVLLEHPVSRTANGVNDPIVLQHHVGAGQVLFHATDETWRWRYRGGEKWLARYWGQAIRQLCRSKWNAGRRGVELETNREVYQPGEAVSFSLRLPHEELPRTFEGRAKVVVSRTGMPNKLLTLERAEDDSQTFSGVFLPAESGDYVSWLAEPAVGTQPPYAEFSVHTDLVELRDVVVDKEKLKEVAQRTGGELIELADAIRRLPRITGKVGTPLETMPSISLWNSWPIILLLFSVLAIDWAWRKSKGLP